VTDTQWVVAPGFEPVAEAFRSWAPAYGKGGGAYCAYLDGRPVVDVWQGTAQPGQPWERDTLCVLMSLSKGLAGVCVQHLVDRGLLDLEQPVATYWPEFAQAGKEKALVRHVMEHTVGLVGPEGVAAVAQPDGTGWGEHQRIVEIIAASPTDWEPGSKLAYHALTFGWIAGEIVRRVAGRTVGQYFADEIATPLGLDAFIGTPADQVHRVARTVSADPSLLPRYLRKTLEKTLAAAKDPTSLTGRAMLLHQGETIFDHADDVFSDTDFLQLEVASGHGTATARAIARLFAMQAGGGELDGVRVLSREIVEDGSRPILSEPDYVMADVEVGQRFAKRLAKISRTKGFLGNASIPGLGPRFGPNPDAFGAEGLGGQHGWCDVRSRIAVGYVRSQHAFVDGAQAHLDSLLYSCARAAGHDVFQPARPSVVSRALGAYTRRVALRPGRAATH
jgi:CubicO group peptidase (beta-lactamase class C family)